MLEYPRYRTHVTPGADAAALKSLDDMLLPGMVLAFDIDLVGPNWRNGETILVTENGQKRMHGYPMEFQVIKW